jgi:hypothetical protein
MRIRHFGFLANGKNAIFLRLYFPSLGSAPRPLAEQKASTTNSSSDLSLCPQCGGPRVVVERLTVAQFQLCSPPVLVSIATCFPLHHPFYLFVIIVRAETSSITDSSGVTVQILR